MINVKKGSTATVTTISDERVRKYFHESIEKQRIIQEFRMLEELERTVVPTPNVYAVELEDSPFIEMQRIDGNELLELFEPSRITDFLNAFATLHQQIHQQQSRVAPEWHDVIQQIVHHLPPALRLKAERLLEKLHIPQQQGLLHGDFHFQNILVSVDETFVVIDWHDATTGPPIADVARTLLLLRTAGGTVVPDEMRRYVCREYLDRYQAVSSIQLSNLADWLRLMAILRTLEQVSDAEQSRLEELISHPDLGAYFFNT
ncbi:aminoglycoside phosphotransferase family protein [Exiguobacterium sp. TBG-PICH-001]|uniref:phosphotransferase family protein n=1 Tax=Exiguobacterium abrahamii TaxID=2785532 RepID=UPI0018A73B18|nr:aminoglycoside phosphotransferase family protein [Exiguobacterium sp. TBG-PICH-001]MBF8153221.1 aminoglycoside phosphotransferase family protein [Exiguobacterium sp. TBG-PICH-001]